MKFVLTLNMPSAHGSLVHQITVDFPEVASSKAFCDLLNDQEFVMGRQYYKRKGFEGETLWEDRGDLIVNSAQIGKVQQFYETEDERHDEPHRSYDASRSYPEVERGAVRPR